MATTMSLIAEQTVTLNGTSSVTFSNIPQTFTDLKLVVSIRNTHSSVMSNSTISFNGSSANKSQRSLYTNVSTTTGSFTYTEFYIWNPGANSTASTFNNAEIYIPNYTSSNYKSFSSEGVAENNGTENELFLNAGLWSNTAAISSITITPTTGFAAGSTFYLYGISNSQSQNNSVPQALGGDVIATDGTYWYHAFKYSGAFVPQKNLTTDVLVIAGGGGGGCGHGGGGGAGGVLAFASQALTSGTSYTCLVGAGGAGGSGGSQGGISGSNSKFGSLTTTVGGGGGGSYNNAIGTTGGSGGGGGGGKDYVSGYAGTSGQGYAGGNGTTNGTAGNGGGGGGAGAAGSNATGGGGSGSGAGGNGGTGVNTVTNWGALSAVLTATATGVSGYIAGGGGGGAWQTTAGTGGAGGGGNGYGYGSGSGTITGYPGLDNTGSGGGGGPDYNNGGGAGGSGIIIVRYAV